MAAAGLLLLLGGTALAAHLWAQWHFEEANRLVDQQQFPEAYRHFEKCLWVWRWSAETHLLAGRTARRALQYPQAEAQFDRCLKLGGRDSATAGAVALERLLIPVQQGEFGDVEELLWEKVKKGVPETPLILEALARGYVRTYRLGAALACLRRILERDPDNVEALAHRGWVHEHTGALTDALKDYRRVLELKPDRDEQRLALATILLRDTAEEARREFERLLERQPDNPKVLLGLAQAYHALGLPAEKARPYIDAVLARDPDNSKALSILALSVDDPSECEVLLRKAIEKDPANLEAHWQLYLCLLQQGRKTEAAAQQERHAKVEADKVRMAQIVGQELTKTPYDPNLHYEMAIIYLRYGKIEKGIYWLQKTLRLDPNHQQARQAYAEHATKGLPRQQPTVLE
jgi:tetratricopeptide (TPR) repeat protein